MSFSTRLKEARERMGISQVELAKRVGVGNTAISNYEKGISFPNVDFLYKIFEALDVEPNYLFQDVFSTTKIVLTAEEKNVMIHYRKLNERGQKMLKEYVRLLSEDRKYSKQNVLLHDSLQDSEMVAYGLDDMKKEEWHPKAPENTAFD